MKIVNLETLMTYPSGTVFSTYQHCSVGDIEVLGDALVDDHRQGMAYTSFALFDPTTNFTGHEEGVECEIETDQYYRTGPGISRDVLYAVFDKKDIETVIERLQRCVEETVPKVKPKEPVDVLLLDVVLNPFEMYPKLREMWKNREGSPEKDMENWLKNPGTEKKFLVTARKLEVVGITGVWEMGPKSLALAWNGILPKEQGKGYGKAAIEHLIEHNIPYHFPDAETLTECIPADKEEELKGFFLKLGFVSTGKTVDHPELYQGVVWKEYIYNLKP